MLIIPVQPVPNQVVSVVLNGQYTQLNIYYKAAYGLFMDVLLNNVIIISGVICWNANRIIRSAYLGYSGDFCWFDNQGTSDPVYTGLGTQYSLVYLTPSDLTAAGVPVIGS